MEWEQNIFLFQNNCLYLHYEKDKTYKNTTKGS